VELLLGGAALLGAGITRVLHDAGDADDVLWRESVGHPGASESDGGKMIEHHPHESPKEHDVAG